MQHIRYKRGVLGYWNETLEAIDEAFLFASRMIMGEAFIPHCTSVLEGNHSKDPESGHYQARAKDFGVRGFVWDGQKEVPADIPEAKWDEVMKLAQRYLDDTHGKGIYFVMIERNPDHFHLQRNRHTF